MGSIKGYMNNYNTIITELGDHSVPKNWEQFVVKRGPGETPGPSIIWSDPQDPENAQPGYGFIADDTTEEETFFYHSDHLGSTSYITDDKGNITQYTVYLPYGELLVDEHSSSEDLPYKFNGKELDEETGLYYYGARYMQPVASVWYGVDPLFEKYPSLSAYNYCAGNPINAVDPDGKYILFINGLRLWHGARDQKTFFNNSFGGKTSIYSDDEFKYWSSKNHNGNEVNIVDYYMEQYQDYNVGFASGSSFWNSQASDRKADGRVKAQQFHDLVQSGDIAIREGETIKIIAHSQGAAHATGFAEQLMEYKTAEGQNMYNIEIIEYIAPHQPKDIQHPKGIKGIQFSHPDDKVASKNWIINGGTEFGRIKDVPVFISGKGNHSVLDNREFIKNGEKYR